MTVPSDDLQRLLAEEPFVRALARQLVAGDADDVVQQTWLRALERSPAAVRSPRHWLACVVRNLVRDRRRDDGRRAARERAAAGDAGAAGDAVVPSSAELLEGEQRRRELVLAVDALPPPLRTVVLLRFYEGLPPRRIAARLTLPVTTVSNRLHDALQRLRHTLDARHGDRRAWLLPLVPFAAEPRALPWLDVLAPATATTGLGVIVTTKTKLFAAAVLLLLLAPTTFVAWPYLAAGMNEPTAGGALAQSGVLDVPVAAHGSSAADEPRMPVTSAPIGPSAVATGSAATGSLLVHVRFADAPHVVAGAGVRLTALDLLTPLRAFHARTDETGTARFDGLPPGSAEASLAAGAGALVEATIAAGELRECTLDVGSSVTITGTVVDGAGAPVGGALIEMANPAYGLPVRAVASAAADGTFSLRGCSEFNSLGARAPGFAASKLYYVEGERGSTQNVRLELVALGGCVEGVVRGPGGVPVAGAVVRVGAGSRDRIVSTPQGSPPVAGEATTDGAGRFRVVGVPAGSAPVHARALGLAPWLGTCDVPVGATAAITIGLAPGVTCRGTVRTADGRAAKHVLLRVGPLDDGLERFETRADDGGEFVLEGLPAGDLVLQASDRDLGKATATIRGRAGETVACALTLAVPVVLRGRLLGNGDAPLARVPLRVEAEGAALAWHRVPHTDGLGRFRVDDCPRGVTLRVRGIPRDHLPLECRGVDPAGGELVLRAARDPERRARVSGRLLDVAGAGAVGASIRFSRQDVRFSLDVPVEAVDGSFAVELQAGLWRASVGHNKHPLIRVGPRRLEAGSTWDVGVLQHTRGGTLVIDDEHVATVRSFSIVAADGEFADGVYTALRPIRSALLAPGTYRLLVSGGDLAAQWIPFTIRADEESSVRVAALPGVRQRLELTRADGGDVAPRIGLDVLRAGEFVHATSTGEHSTARVERAVWLVPGDYTLRTRTEPPVVVPFTIGTTEFPTLRVVLP